jgi:hypothetical protein
MRTALIFALHLAHAFVLVASAATILGVSYLIACVI